MPSALRTDTSGKSIEAEQVRLLSNEVLLRLTDGREIKVSLHTLSEADRKQAMLDQPPALELKVSAKTNRSNSSGIRRRVQIEEESTQVKVAVSKSSIAPYELPLDIVLYVMGEWGDGQHEVIDKVSSTFTLTEKGQVFELVSDAFESRKRERGEKKTEYKGWVVVVFDSAGNRVAMKSSRGEYAENIGTLLALAKETTLDERYEPLGSDKFYEAKRGRRF